MDDYLGLIFGGAAVAGLMLLMNTLISICKKYKSIKDSGMFQDIFHVYRHFKTKEIVELERSLDSPYLSSEDKAVFQYDLLVAILQKDLKINEKNLKILRYLKSVINSDFAVSLYRNCESLLKFHEEKQQFEPIKPISEEHAKKLANIGAGIFFANGLFAYGFMIYMLYFVDINFNNNLEAILAWGGFSFLLMLGIVYLGSRVLKFFMRQSNALKLLSLPKKNLDTLLKENESKSDKQE